MAELRRINVHKIGVLSVAYIVGFAAVVLSLVVGLVASIAATASIVSDHALNIWQKVGYSALALIVALVVYPVINFAFGWVYGAIVGFIVNFVVEHSGGLELQISDESNGRK